MTDVCTTLVAAGQKLDWAVETFVAEPVAAVSSGHGWWDDADGVAATIRAQDSITKADTLVAEPVAFSCKDHGADATEGVAPTLRAMGHSGSHANAGGQVAVAIGFNARQDPDAWLERTGPLDADGSTQAVAVTGHVSHALTADGHDASEDGTGRGTPIMSSGYAVRRLSVTECERLMGFPDGWTQVPYRGKPAADGPRYKALGNSKAVNVIRWVGRRIEMVDAIMKRNAGNHPKP